MVFNRKIHYKSPIFHSYVSQALFAAAMSVQLSVDVVPWHWRMCETLAIFLVNSKTNPQLSAILPLSSFLLPSGKLT